MTSATTILTILAMLWHAVAGCCAHHVHETHVHAAAEHHSSETARAAVVNSHACGHASHAQLCDHQHAAESEHSGDHSHPHGMCDDAGCVFPMPDAAGQISSLTKSIGCLPYFDTALLAAITFQLVEQGETRWQQMPCDRVSHSGSRRHLQLAVLLI